MLSATWIFIGILVGLLVVAVFEPPIRKDPHLPIPNHAEKLHTDNGCVKFTTKEVPCTNEATSLNLVASQHK